MSTSLKRIQIVGLHGNKTVDIKIRDNTLILVGENGSGKTTILRILFHFLSGSWLSLFQFRFDEIIATIDGIDHKVTHTEVVKNFKIDSQILGDLPPPIRHRVLELALELTASDQLDRVPIELHRIIDRYGIPLERIMRRIEMSEEMDDLTGKIQMVRSAISAQILYLPTYRRIERELGSILEHQHVDPDSIRRQRSRYQPREIDEGFIELVEFGMRDVENAIGIELVNLKEFARENLNKLTLRYLGDVVNQKYRNVSTSEIADVSEDTLHSVLNRIDESILTKETKDHLYEKISSARSEDSPDEHSMIIFHYFLKLLEFQESLKEKEKPISDFCELCSEYTVDKRLVYDSANFSFSIVSKDDKRPAEQIKLSELSSGEKQIVSLFSHLYLSGQKSYFVLIDEPELSLSVPWQRRFLADIHKGGFCVGLIAATHSPFIYDNDLRQYARSLGEFTST